MVDPDADALFATVEDCRGCGRKDQAEITFEPENGNFITYCSECGYFMSCSRPELVPLTMHMVELRQEVLRRKWRLFGKIMGYENG